MIKFLHVIRIVCLAALMSLPLNAAATETNVSVVLVHGAFSDGSAWREVVPILQSAGVSVSAAQLPMSSLAGDVAVVSRLIESQEGPVVLVGHSYGGSVITEAGADQKVAAMVYVAGFALDAGQSLSDLLKGKPPAAWRSEVAADEAGYVRLSPAGVATYFAPDLSPTEAALIAATQAPIQAKINDEALTVAAWSTRRTYYVVTEGDQIIPPRLQRYFAERMQAAVTTIAASHAAILSQPEAVANVILSAVRDVSIE